MLKAVKGKAVYAVLRPDEIGQHHNSPEYCERRYRDKRAAVRDADSVPGTKVYKISVDRVLGKYEGVCYHIAPVYENGGKENE